MQVSSMFKPATRRKLKLRMAIDGPTGSGKSYTAQRLMRGIVGADARIAVLDTEHRSMSKYLGESPDGYPWQFDVCELEHYAPSTYTAAIRDAGRAGYAGLIIDSLSHAWEGVGGALDQIDKKGGSSFTAWKDVTPMHREMIEAILACPCHVIVTMRSKMEYILEEQQNKQGRVVQVPKKVGMQPVQRAGMEYEFDVVADLDIDHTLTISKSRCSTMDGAKAVKPGPEFVQPLRVWLEEGVAVAGDVIEGLQSHVPGREPVRQQLQQPQQQQAQPQAPPAQHIFQPIPPQYQRQQKAKPTLGGQRDNATSIKETDPCQEWHRGRILQLAEYLGLEPADIRGVLAKRHVEKLAQLTVQQAEELIRNMEQRALLQEANVAFDGPQQAPPAKTTITVAKDFQPPQPAATGASDEIPF